MTENDQKELGKMLREIADDLRCVMNAIVIMKFSTHGVENLNEMCT